MVSVVMLTWEYPPDLVGGLARHVEALARELARQGCHVHVITRFAEGLPFETDQDGVHILRVRPYFQEPDEFRLWVTHLNFALLEAGVNLLRTIEDPVILHAHDWLVAHAAKGLKHLFRFPLVATIHATEHGRNGGLCNASQRYINDIEWWLTYEAWRVIVCSHAMNLEVQRLFGLGADKIHVIPNGVALPAALVSSRDPEWEPMIQPGERLLFHLGRLVPEKGAASLLEAISKLQGRHRIRLVIGGVGSYRAELEQLVARLRLSGQVYFAGKLSDEEIQSLYCRADAVAVPSTYEPFGIVALEAMAAGAPLIVSDVGGLAELVRHEENGLKVPPGDSAALAKQLDRILSDRVLAERMAISAREEVRKRYTWSRVAARTADVYSEVLQASHASNWPPAYWPIPPASGSLPGRYAISE